jgi:PAS domain S-box-containing protein
VSKEKRSPEAEGLRCQAENRLEEKGPDTAIGDDADARRMLHELQVHQIELELQNEELKQAREDLEKQLEKYSDLYNFAPVGYFTLDVNGTIREANLTGSKLLGIDRSHLVGSRFAFLVSGDSRPTFNLFLASVFGGTSRETCEVALESDRQRYLQVEGVAVESAAGVARECRLAVIDISQRVQAEEALHRYELLSYNSRDIVLLMRGDDGSILEANVAALNAYGYSRDELLRLTVYNLRSVATLGLTISQMLQADAKGILFETVHRRKDGSTFPVEVSAQGATISGTRTLISVIRDITERKQTEESLNLATTRLMEAKSEVDHIVEERTSELKRAYETLRVEIEERRRAEAELIQSQKMEAMGTLAGGIAHDFNNILAAIIGFGEMAKSKTPKESPAWRHMDRVVAGGIRGRELVKQILAFSRRAQQEKRPTRLAAVVKDTLTLLRASLPAMIDIRSHIETEFGFVLADPIQIQQVVMNLCTNAAHSMRRTGGTIFLHVSGFSLSSYETAPDSTMTPGLYARLSITDTGEGIPPNILKHIFDPFFTTKDRGEGTGLGLSVVHGIVASHNGAIAVSSKPGKGSTFTIYLPVMPEEQTQAADDGENAILRGHERILFVDDEKDLAAIGDEILTGLGYRVTQKTRPREALALFRLDPSRFDLVITDQTMPDMTGMDLIKEILTLRADIPIIICTGFSHLVDVDSAKKAGIKAFVIKPLTKKELAMAVRKAIDE